jgi:hypothetical protein
MLETTVWPWTALILLGALHGVNPGMGWLFAVALGLQEGSGRAVWRALPPLMVGHALAVAAAVGLAVALGLVVHPAGIRWGVAAALLAMGVFQLIRHRHPRFGGMRVGFRDLVIWSFLMATAHGAGLMAVPFVPGPGDPPAAALHHGAHGHGAHGHSASRLVPGVTDADDTASGAATTTVLTAGPVGTAGRAGGAWLAALATVVHTLGYLLVTGAVAAVVFYRVGLALLRRAWVNLDRVWAGALIATAVLIVLT